CASVDVIGSTSPSAAYLSSPRAASHQPPRGSNCPLPARAAGTRWPFDALRRRRGALTHAHEVVVEQRVELAESRTALGGLEITAPLTEVLDEHRVDRGTARDLGDLRADALGDRGDPRRVETEEADGVLAEDLADVGLRHADEEVAQEVERVRPCPL